MRLGFVTPRYGPQIMGGAETAARMLAEHAVATLGWPVEVFSTCALDHISWENELTEGDSEINGVVVHRFPTASPRSADFFALDGILKHDPAGATPQEATQWVALNGPDAPGLFDAIADTDCDVVAFYPYLFASTVEGVRRCRAATVLHPAAHDEPALYLSVFREIFSSASALVYHTEAERKLVQRVFPVAERHQTVLGLGIGEMCGTGRPGGEILGIGDRPYLVSVGRVDEMKGSKALAAFFREYKRLYPGPLALALVGPVSVELPDHPDVVVTGPVDEADKWDILAGAVGFVSPSAYESFSLVIMEAWAAGLPVLVNGTCAVTREHCELSGGGLWFGSFREFARVVGYLCTHPDAGRELGSRGRRYVEERYRWPELIQRYGTFLEKVVIR